MSCISISVSRQIECIENSEFSWNEVYHALHMRKLLCDVFRIDQFLVTQFPNSGKLLFVQNLFTDDGIEK